MIGEAAKVEFKATGKEILEPGWRVLFPKKEQLGQNGSKDKQKEEERILPIFKQGETGPHSPTLVEKTTQPPKHFTEATLLRAMETAGKKVDDEELRDLMKANGIGRPSTRANIIETLFRRRYIQRKRKLLIATETGIQLIDTIGNELLKSAELTGKWEKQLREIEQGNYKAQLFIRDMKNMVSDLVTEVRTAKPGIRIAHQSAATTRSAATKAGKRKSMKIEGLNCPKCIKGQLLEGKTAYGCSRWKESCTFRLPFEFMDKKISEKQMLRLLRHGATIQLKGFRKDQQKLNGRLRFDNNFQLNFEPLDKPSVTSKTADTLACPKCSNGKVIKGKTAYGCSRLEIRLRLQVCLFYPARKGR